MDKGVAYPFSRGDKGYFRAASGIDLIEGNILQILGTIPGERVMLPEFGCKVRTVLFDHINAATLALAQTYVADAIRRWEQRVTLLDVQVEAQEDAGVVVLRLTYRYKETGAERTSTIMIAKEGVSLRDGYNANAVAKA